MLQVHFYEADSKKFLGGQDIMPSLEYFDSIIPKVMCLVNPQKIAEHKFSVPQMGWIVVCEESSLREISY